MILKRVDIIISFDENELIKNLEYAHNNHVASLPASLDIDV